MKSQIQIVIRQNVRDERDKNMLIYHRWHRVFGQHSNHGEGKLRFKFTVFMVLSPGVS